MFRPTDPRSDPLAEISGRELLMIIDEELQRLPEVYRLAVILCCLEGRSLDEAARQLGWTPGSVKGRLERGRARLHERLLRRGLTLSASLVATEVSRGAAPAASVARLVARTVPEAMAFTIHRSRAASASAALARDVIKDMALAKSKLAGILTLASCLLAAVAFISRANRPPAIPTPPAAQTAAAASAEETPIRVSGRVLDPQGQPVAGAELYVGYSDRRVVRRYPTVTDAWQSSYPLRTTSRADGRFHFAFARSALDARKLDDSRPAVVAVAGGYGPDWAEVGEPGQDTKLNLRLVEDHPISGRILDPNRKPVAGASISVRDVIRDSPEGIARFLRGDFRTDVTAWRPRIWRGPLPGQPVHVTTDADGHFRLAGLGRDRIVRLALEGPTIQYTVIEAATRPSPATPFFAGIHGATFDFPTRQSCSICGVVRDQVTGRPVAGVKMSTQQADAMVLTDADGRFEIRGCPKLQQGYHVTAQPPTGQPYFAASAWVPEASGLGPLTANFELVSGIPLSGRVTDQATQKPPRAGLVEYYPLFPNPYSGRITNSILQPASSAVIQPDGSYRLTVLAGPGAVCVAASPRDSYAVALVREQDFAGFLEDGIKLDRRRRLRAVCGAGGHGFLCLNKYSALSLINLDEKAEFLALDFILQPARTLQGTVVGPDGMPVTGVKVMGLGALPEDELLEGSSFTVVGLNPCGARALFFRHREKGLGKFMTILGDQTEPLTVQLDPCGSVLGRLVHNDGKPAPGVTVAFFGAYGREAKGDTDRQGRFRVDGLVPGQKYSLTPGLSRLQKDIGEVQVESGRSKDLGDLALQH